MNKKKITIIITACFAIAVTLIGCSKQYIDGLFTNKAVDNSTTNVSTGTATESVATSTASVSVATASESVTPPTPQAPVAQAPTQSTGNTSSNSGGTTGGSSSNSGSTKSSGSTGGSTSKSTGSTSGGSSSSGSTGGTSGTTQSQPAPSQPSSNNTTFVDHWGYTVSISDPIWGSVADNNRSTGGYSMSISTYNKMKDRITTYQYWETNMVTGEKQFYTGYCLK